MENNTGLSQLSVTDSSADALRKWQQQYEAMDAEIMAEDDPLIKEADADILDVKLIESFVEEASKRITVAKGFCNGCRNMFENWPTIGIKHGAHGIARHVSTSEMEAARRKGCRSCAFSLSHVDSDILDTFRKLETRLAILNNTKSASISVWNWGSVGGTQCIWVNLPGKVTTDSNASLAQLWNFESHVVSPFANIYDEPVAQFDQIRTWLQKCLQEHKLCKSKRPIERPRRLVKIADGNMRLVLTDDILDTPYYATLSYSWGNKNFLKLTRNNLESFFQSIPEEELPTSFTDAILIARELGLQYIWIDALCIVQDESDHSDWLNESGKMRSVYGSTHVNIAATAATDVQGGCFSRIPSYTGGFLARVSTRKYCCVRNFHSRNVYDASTSETHLASRAWALQERILAPRTLYMGERGIFWECRSTWASEFLPEGSPDILGTQLVIPEDAPWAWGDIVRLYSSARLTHAADKLPALSGIARRQHETNGGNYIAGMWESNLLRQLVWVCNTKGQRTDWRAPSWSWTSVDAPTHYWNYWDSTEWDPTEWDIGLDDFARILNVWTTPVGPDPFGAVIDGELRMACQALVHGRYVAAGDQEGMQDRVTIDTSEEYLTLSMDTIDDATLNSGATLILLPLIGGKSGMSWGHVRKTADTPTSAEAGVDEVEKGMQSVRQGLTASEILKIPDESQLSTTNESELSDQEQSESEWGGPEEEGMFISGLAMSSLDNQKGVFRRVGSFRFDHRKPVHGPDLETDQYTEFIRLMEEVGASTAASRCAEVLLDSDEMKYVIVLR